MCPTQSSAARANTVRADEILLQDHIALNGRRVAVFLVLHEVVDAGGAGAQHLEHHHRVGHDSGVARAPACRRQMHLGSVSNRRRGSSDRWCRRDKGCPASVADRYAEIPLYRRVAARATGHRGRGETIELPAQFLPFFPGQERLHRHRAADGNAHAAAYHGAAVEFSCLGDRVRPSCAVARHQRLPESGHSADLSGSDRSHEALTLVHKSRLSESLLVPARSRVTLSVRYDRNRTEKRRLGYARVSTYGRTLDAQLEQLRADGCAKIFREKGRQARGSTGANC